MTHRPLLVSLAAFVVVLTGCPNDPTQTDDLSWMTDDPARGDARLAVIDVEGTDEWQYFSFENGHVSPADPADSLEWDIAFQRYNVKTNGGTSGKGQGAASDLGDLSMETTTDATVKSWKEDSVIEDARTGEKQSMNSVLSGWYSYHFIKHELVSKYDMYAVRAADGRIALFKMRDYYDAAGTAGHITILYRFPTGADVVLETPNDDENEQPPGELLPDEVREENGIVFGETNFDARERNERRYFSFDARGPVDVSAPSTDDSWDLSFAHWLMQSNSGTSGGGGGGAQQANTKIFADATVAPDDGWLVDDVQSIGSEERLESTNRAFAGWFDYDPTTQRIFSNEDVYWIRTAKGGIAKLQILAYYHPETNEQGYYRLRWAYRADGGESFAP